MTGKELLRKRVRVFDSINKKYIEGLVTRVIQGNLVDRLVITDSNHNEIDILYDPTRYIFEMVWEDDEDKKVDENYNTLPRYIDYAMKTSPTAFITTIGDELKRVEYVRKTFSTDVTPEDNEIISRIFYTLDSFQYCNNGEEAKYIILGKNPYSALLKYQYNNSHGGVFYDTFRNTTKILDPDNENVIRCLGDNRDSFIKLL